MEVQKKTSYTQSNRAIQYTHIVNDSKAVCFMFSGAGYNYDKPLFYYSTMIMLENNFDVIHIHYSYDEREFNLTINEFTDLMVEDVTTVVKDVLEKGEYSQTIFLGKSLGTIPITASLAKNENYSHSKVILLTPLLKIDLFYKGILESQNETFMVIGKNDAHYVQEKIKKLDEKSNLVIKGIDNANHSLDVEPFDYTSSLKALSEMMKDLNNFLN
ncbi:alpha/beta family hydrolase [Virgibacillus kekensis]|uniref:Alpha/beta family hydrolase n=1 Tax=Virgibacillus kekensis TaxID=202261 RepID=A0ABV9DKR3_9BACI